MSTNILEEESKDHTASTNQEPWEAQVGWTYMGHGEWTQNDIGEDTQWTNEILTEPYWVQQWLAKNDEDIALHHEVNKRGYPNRWGARLKVNSGWNLEKLQVKLQDYEDKEVVEWLHYGWPMGRLPTLPPPDTCVKNHKGATDFPQHLTNYISKERQKGAVMGPYDKIPFPDKVGISPLSTRPKKGSEERRVILDLSFPVGNSVNEGIPKDTYLGFTADLTFPKTDDFALRIFNLGPGCYMFKIDLSRYFRQIPLDPGDYSLIGYIIDVKVYFDKVLPMGMRSAPYIAQRITNAIAFIHWTLGFFLLNYVDDFVGAELREKIWQAYTALADLLEELGVETSKGKLVLPTTRLEFLGVTFDSQSMTMEISEEKLAEIRTELEAWLYKVTATRKEVESLVGKLQFMAKCIKAGRVFLGRLINWIRTMDRGKKYSIPMEARRDIAWWGRFAHKYNGVSLMWCIKELGVDTLLQTDACPKGYGGICGEEYIRGRFPQHLQGTNIAILEIWAVMVALKVWAHKLKGKYFWILVDNEAVAVILNTGRSREQELQNTLREIAYIAATNQFVIKARHILGVDNRIPDWLSRWDEPQARWEFRAHAKDSGLKHIRTKNSLLQYTHQW